MSGPLAGRVLLVTRPGEQGRALAEHLRALGAEAIEAPTIVVEGPDPGGPLDDAVRQASEGRFAWTVFTSASGVRAWLDRAAVLRSAAPAALVAAVGDATAEALRAGGVEPALVPEAFTIEALGEAFPQGSGRVLLARADLATGHLEEVLRSKGWTPVRVDAYRVRPAEALPDQAGAALRSRRVDAVTFTSPSTVQGFVRLAGDHPRPAALCIGPVTAEVARSAGFTVAAVARRHTAEGLVEAALGALGRPGTE